MLAALCPYASGYCGLVIADGIAPPFTLVAHHGFEVGRLVPLPVPVRGRTMKRDVGDGDLFAVANAVQTVLREHSVSALYIEASGALGTRVAMAVRAAAESIGVAVIDAPSLDFAGRHGSARGIVDASFIGWPAHSHSNIEFAAAALVRSVNESARAIETVVIHDASQSETPARGSETEVDHTPARSIETFERTNGMARTGETASMPEAQARASGTPVSFIPPCRIGIDPGSSHIGVAIVDSTGSLVHHETIPVGHEEPLPKPRIIQRSDGSTIERTTRHLVSQDDVENAVAAIDELLTRFGVTRAIIEWVTFARMGSDAIMSSSIASRIAQSQWIGGALHAWCASKENPDIDTSLVVAREWTVKVTKAARTKGRRGAIAPVIETRWPSICGGDEHQRDAAGCVLWDILREEKNEPPKADVVRTKRVRTRVDRDGKTAAQRKREEAGCHCSGRRHSVGCPLYVRIEYRKDRGT